MALSEKAWRYLKARPQRVNLLHGSVRSSKTVNSLLVLPKRIANAPKNGEIIFTGKTERTLYRNVISPLIKMYGRKRVKYSKGSGEGSFGGRSFFAIGAHNESAEDNVRGLTAAYWYADEVVTYPEVVTDMAMSRLSLEHSVADLTCNPGPPGHYINQKIILPYQGGERSDAAVWHFLLEDNPNLPQNYLEFLRNQYPIGSLFYKRNILGLWVLAEGTVYDFFDMNIHIHKSDPQKEPEFIDLSCDYGTANPLVVGVFWGWKKPLENNLRVFLKRGFYYDSKKHQQQLTDSEYADRIDKEFAEEKLNHRYFIVDPSAASFIQELKRRGWNVKAANNDVLDGIKTQAKMLKSGQFALSSDSSLKPFVDEYGAYLWDEKAQAKGEDKPMKTNDHCFIGSTMVETSRGPKAIRDIREGEMVLTRLGYQKVLRAWMTQKNAEVFEVKFSNGSSLTGTANHPVFVQGKGFTPLDALRYGNDTIVTCKMYEQLFTKESSLEDTQMPNNTQTAVITGRIRGTLGQALRLCIEKFGKTITAQFQKVATFTIKTLIPTTTTLQTSSVSPQSSTPKPTREQDLCDLSLWQKCKRQLRLGIKAPREGLGTQSLPENPLRSASQYKRSVPNVARNSKHSEREMPLNFVPTIANLSGAERLGLITSLENASFVDVSLPLTNTTGLKLARVAVEPKYVGKADVYNLTVEHLPEFFAEGVLVHNCLDMTRYLLHTLYRKEHIGWVNQ